MRKKDFPKINQREAMFLLDCCTTRPGSERAGRITTILGQGDFNWDLVVPTAVSQGVLPLLYRTLKDVCSQMVPAALMEKLRILYLNNAARNLAAAYELIDIINALDRHGVDAVPFKGPTLAECYFGELALRQFTDLDILIHPDDAVTAFQVLKQLGYQPKIGLDADQIEKYIVGEYSLEFDKSGSSIAGQIDLHWELTGKFSRHGFGLERLGPGLREVDFFGGRVKQMSPEDLLVYLCIHGAKECWRQLGLVCCVAQVLQVEKDLDWDYIFKITQWMRCRRRLYLGLCLADKLIGTPLPAGVAHRIAGDPAIGSIAADIQAGLFTNAGAPNSARLPNYFSTFHLSVNDHHADRIRYIIRSFFQPTRIEWQELPLPPSIHFLHYLYRPFHLIRNASRSLTNFKPS